MANLMLLMLTLAPQNDSPLDVESEIHHQHPGVLVKFLTFQTKKRLIK
jgi:hypothetical protein